MGIVRRYLLVILLLLSIILILLAYVFDRGSPASLVSVPVVLISVGTSILATVVFAWIYDLKIDEMLHKNAQEKYEELTPLESFPASNSPIKAFNDLYNEALAKTTSIRYKGDKALYLAYRLRKSIRSRSPWIRIELLLPNPERDEPFHYRAQNLMGSERYKDYKSPGLAARLKRELLASILALSDMRENYNFEIYFYDEIPFLRYEILDSILVVSALTMQQLGYYPPTLVYGKKSLFYSTFLTNFSQLKDLAAGTVMTHNTISEEQILNLAKKADLDVTIEDLRKVYEDYFEKAE